MSGSWDLPFRVPVAPGTRDARARKEFLPRRIQKEASGNLAPAIACRLWGCVNRADVVTFRVRMMVIPIHRLAVIMAQRGGVRMEFSAEVVRKAHRAEYGTLSP